VRARKRPCPDPNPREKQKEMGGQNVIRTLRARPTTTNSKCKGCNPSIQRKKEKKIQDIYGHREHQLAEVNTSAATERNEVKQEMKNAPNHPHSNHTVEDEVEVVRAALRGHTIK
jgi:hypothetical protein